MHKWVIGYNWHLYLSDVWLDVVPRTNTILGINDTSLNEIGLHTRNMIIILGSGLNIIEGGGEAYMTIL